MKYKYDTHVHSMEGSACAVSSIREMVHAYHEAGYAGFVVTDHFIHGNTAIPKKGLSWNERTKRYYDVYLQAKEEADKLDLDVFFGIEHWYEKSREILIYGIDLDFLHAHPELETGNIDTYAKLVHEAGGILVHAHPYRERDYIPADFQPRIDVCDGIEVYNAGDPWEHNKLALQDAIVLGKLPFSGGDMHRTLSPKLGNAGILFDRRVKSMSEFLKLIKARKYSLIIDGKEYSLEDIMRKEDKIDLL